MLAIGVGALARYAPVTAVKGNNDTDLDVPSTAHAQNNGHRIAIVHDSGAAHGRSTRLTDRFPDADLNTCDPGPSDTEVRVNRFSVQPDG